MNIAVFTKSTTFHIGHGGLETQNKVLCEGLVTKGHKITVFTPKREVQKPEIVENGVLYIFIECSYRYLFSALNSQSWYNRSYEVFKDYHNKAEFDLVLGQSSAAIGIISRKEEHNIPVVSISHGTTLGELKTRLNNIRTIKDILRLLKDGQYVIRQFFGRQRDFVLKSSHVIAVSNAVKQNLIEETFVPEENVTVITNGIDPNVFSRVKEGRTNTGKSVLFVGQLTKDKGIDYLIEIFSDSAFSQNTLYVCGDGPLKSVLEEQIDSKNLNSRIKLLGKIPYTEVVNFYLNPEVAIFAFPTKREEGLPMVLVEAMFAGLPVVAFNKGGVSDVVKDQETGYLVSPNDTELYRSKLLTLLNSTENLQKFSDNALKYAYSTLTLNAMIEKYEAVFKKVTKK